MLLRVLWILLLLPFVELLLTAWLYYRYGTPFLACLLLAGVLGALLISRAKAGFRAALAPLQGGNVRVYNGSLLGFLASARTFFAGALLVFPGVITDLLALAVLLLPGRLARAAGAAPVAANDGVIEGEFHEVQEPREPLEDRRAQPRP